MKRKVVIISLVLLISIITSITIRSLKDDSNLSFFEKTIKDSVNVVCKVITSPVKVIKKEIDFYKEKKDLYKKYVTLLNKVEKTDLYKSQIEELQKELAEYKSILELNDSLSEYTYVNSTVINRNIGYFYNSLTIDKGSKSGIDKGYAVIVSNGLIGKVVKVSNFSSSVKLLTTDELNDKISIKISTTDGYVFGLLSGYDKDKDVYKIEGVTNISNIKPNDKVTTTGLSDSFSSGILIGKVEKVTSDEYDLNKIIEVKPSVDFSDIEVVTVIKRKALK